jgi:glucuronoarabinoxylan endo-1,4-beta-xylanase
VTGFYKVAAGSEPMIDPFQGYIMEGNQFTAAFLPLSFGTLATIESGVTVDEVKVYPNPFKTEFSIDVNKDDTFYTIYDAKGSLIVSKTKLSSGKNRIEALNLPSGLYFMEVTVAGKTSVHKLIKK